MQKIVPNIWFAHQAEEAANFYVSLFSNSSIDTITHYSEVGREIHGMEAGSVLTVEFTLEGYSFLNLNGGPAFTPNPSISFFVNCQTKEEVTKLWEAFSQDGKVLMPLDKYDFSEYYGWVQDRFGVSWQLTIADENTKQKIVPSLLFTEEKAGKAEEAIGFYTNVFKNARAGNIFRYGPGMEPDSEDSVMYGDFTLEGQLFTAMDSAREHNYTFNEAISLIVNCDDQAEVDYYWEKLSAVPEAEQCGWLKDKYGVAWQITPVMLYELLGDQETEASKRAMDAMMRMKKLDIAALQAAYDGETSE